MFTGTNGPMKMKEWERIVLDIPTTFLADGDGDDDAKPQPSHWP